MPAIIGHYQQQSSGCRAFVPLPFPPEEPLTFSSAVHLKHAEAVRLIGKLDGISQLLPDRDFFLLMFVRKEAASSSQIEGTQATMVDAIEAEIESHPSQQGDVGDIIHYIRALNYGLERATAIPLAFRFICELHQELMKDGRFSHHPYPGEIRRTQNWIQGTSPANARFVPPPPHEIPRALSDIEKFIHSKTDGYTPLIKAALIHAQFETVHPFCDGNGRTGRLLVTMYLWQERLLSAPVLYLSDFFKKHQNLYYLRLQGYHDNEGEIEAWVDFFLEGVMETANSAIQLVHKIIELREADMTKVHKLGKQAAESSIELLRQLYKQPIVDNAKIQEWTGFTRSGALKVIDRFVELGILVPRTPPRSYGRSYEYRAYLQLFDL